MTGKKNGAEQTPTEKFTAYNPYAQLLEDLEELDNNTTALLAVAFELKQLNGAVRFGGGRSK
jgi:hypothetical protein